MHVHMKKVIKKHDYSGKNLKIAQISLFWLFCMNFQGPVGIPKPVGIPRDPWVSPGTRGYLQGPVGISRDPWDLDPSAWLRGRKVPLMSVRPGAGPAAYALTTADVVSTAPALGTAGGPTGGATTVNSSVTLAAQLPWVWFRRYSTAIFTSIIKYYHLCRALKIACLSSTVNRKS